MPKVVAAPPTEIVVDFSRGAPQERWFVSGLEEEVQTELLRFHSLHLARKIDPGRCPGRDPRCLVEQYRVAGVELVVLGELEPRGRLRYGVYETWTGSRAFDGLLVVSGVTTPMLERGIDAIVRQIVQRGGLLDQRPVAPAQEPAREAGSQARARSPSWRLPGNIALDLVGATLAFFVAPILLVLAMVGAQELGRRATPRSWKWSAVLAVAISSLWTAAALVDAGALLGHLGGRAARVVDLSWPVAAGMLWGAFGLTIAVWVFAPIQGLERIRHDAVWPLMRSWTLLALLRAVAFVGLYLPVAELTRRGCVEVALPERVTWAIVLPAAGLLTHFWVLSLVDNLSVYLDARLVSGPPTPRNPWHATLARYFRGYVRRNVIAVDEKVLARTLFLPGTRPGVVSYGGGFARPRIVAGEGVLTAALGELPDEEEVPDRTINPEDFTVGAFAPALESEDGAHEQRAEEWRRRLTLAPPRARAYMPRLLGQNATLLGWVLPQPIEEGIPLISDTEEDFGVVKRLLSEHYAAFQGINDDEVDDTDPTQKDFLFGALLREVGVATRRDSILATLSLTLDVATSKKSWLARLVRLPLTLYDRTLSAPATRVADAYAALNGAFHYLVQYLCLARGVGEELLTARANVPRLVDTSRRMLAQLDGREQAGDARELLGSTSRDRAAWLARIFQGPHAPRRFHWMRLLGGIAVAAALGLLLFRSVSSAIAYHPTYVQRMSAQSSPPSPDSPATEGEKTR
jgi:hypothetical protein